MIGRPANNLRGRFVCLHDGGQIGVHSLCGTQRQRGKASGSWLKRLDEYGPAPEIEAFAQKSLFLCNPFRVRKVWFCPPFPGWLPGWRSAYPGLFLSPPSGHSDMHTLVSPRTSRWKMSNEIPNTGGWNQSSLSRTQSLIAYTTIGITKLKYPGSSGARKIPP